MNEGAYLAKATRGPLNQSLRDRLTHAWPKVQLDAMLELSLLIGDRTVEEGDCLLWTGATSVNGSPRIWIDGSSDVLRRLIWAAVRGEPAPEDRIGANCGVASCIEPSHLAKRSRSQDLKGIKRDPSFGAKIAATKRASSRFTPEIVDEVRASPLNNVALGKEMGINHQTIARMRRHEIWKSYSTPFAGLGARA